MNKFSLFLILIFSLLTNNAYSQTTPFLPESSCAVFDSYLGSKALFSAAKLNQQFAFDVPSCARRVEFKSVANSPSGYGWESEDTLISEGVIDLIGNRWSGMRVLTGGNGGAQTQSVVWNDQPFGDNVDGEGDLSTSGYGHEKFASFLPRISKTESSFTLELVPPTFADAQTSVFLKFYGK